MSVRSQVVKWLRPTAAKHPKLKQVLLEAETRVGLLRHSAASILPVLIQPQMVKMTVAITANCNLRCLGCRYGRDFMAGSQLSLQIVRDLLDDGAALGAETIRIYGGEPLLHPDLPHMIEHALGVGIKPYVTTNGVLLKKRLDSLYSAGLRDFTIGLYGTGAGYDAYVQRSDQFREVEAGISTVRERYGNAVSLQFNFLLMRPTCSVEVVGAAWELARRYDMQFSVDLIHYSLPYFSEGPDACLQFTPDDLPYINRVVDEFLRMKSEDPARFPEPVMSIRSIPDWLIKRSAMRVPCDVYKLIWVGADGTVQLCYVTFKLGNLHEQRLRDMLYTQSHRQAARDAFALNCPNCHCERTSRIQKHSASRAHYA